MDLTEDLRVLQDLHERGKLTDLEFADAKAVTLKKYHAPRAESRSLTTSIRPRTAVLLAVLLLLVGLVWYRAGSEPARTIATAVHTPIEVKSEIENLPSASWKAISVGLPYSGKVNVDLEVVRGNPIDVFLTNTDQLEIMKEAQWNQLKTYSDFTALKAKTYRRKGQLGQGSYYLVLRDTSLGILSSSTSDVSVKVQLSP